MQKNKWSDKLNAGIEELDTESKIILEVFNRIFKAAEANNIESIVFYLNDLLSYLKLHFMHEETFMRQYHYPEYEAHKLEHVDMYQKMSNMLKLHTTGVTALIPSIKGTLSLYVEDHVKEQDKKLGEYLNCKKTDLS